MDSKNHIFNKILPHSVTGDVMVCDICATWKLAAIRFCEAPKPAAIQFTWAIVIWEQYYSCEQNLSITLFNLATAILPPQLITTTFLLVYFSFVLRKAPIATPEAPSTTCKEIMIEINW